MADLELYRNLLYHYELLKARLIMREHYLKTIVRDVYENIGQVLALVRVQLGILELGVPVFEKSKSDSPDKLVESSIRLLRDMCQRFYPDLQINSAPKLNNAIAQLVESHFPGVKMSLPAENMSLPMQENRSLILAAMLIDILTLLKANGIAVLIGTTVKYSDRKIVIELDYEGTELQGEERQRNDPFSGSIGDRARLLKGRFEIKNMRKGRIRIKLVMPIN